LFTPARYLGLNGMKFPARGTDFPTKDDMAAYLQAYADRFDLPVRHAQSGAARTLTRRSKGQG
jgi:putative flavoprotein involved in K+ transport